MKPMGDHKPIPSPEQRLKAGDPNSIAIKKYYEEIEAKKEQFPRIFMIVEVDVYAQEDDFHTVKAVIFAEDEKQASDMLRQRIEREYGFCKIQYESKEVRVFNLKPGIAYFNGGRWDLLGMEIGRNMKYGRLE